MVEDLAPSTSDQSTAIEDELAVSSCNNSKMTHSKNSNKRRNVNEKKAEKPNILSHKHSNRKSPGEKLEMSQELLSRFSYVRKKCKTAINVGTNDQETCSSEIDEPCSSSTATDTDGKPGHSVGNGDVRMSVKRKSNFKMKFSQRISDTLLEVGKGTVKTHQFSLYRSNNVLHYVNGISQGLSCSSTLKKVKKNPIVSHVSDMGTFARTSPFNRRVTALTYHPKYPAILGAGSKGGEMIFWNTEKLVHELTIPEIGPGGSILSMKFHHEKQTIVYTASLTGRVMQQDFIGKDNMTFYDTQNFDIWFSSLDTSAPHKLLLAGDTRGYLYLSNFDGQKVWKFKNKVHKNKVTHAEFSLRDSFTFVTASLDHTVRIWDLRMFSDKMDCPRNIHCLEHDKGVNSAYFNPSNGTSLLTTDQQKELRVYTAPLWHLETTIAHPHRQFQHLTPIKAQWHPLEDLIVVGRYPDEEFCSGDMRSIDIYDGHTGERKHCFTSTGIVSLNAFNPTGDVLASASGTIITLRKSKEECKESVKISNAAALKLLNRGSRSSNRARSKLVTNTKEKKTKKQKKA